MTWVRLDDQFPDHPKVDRAGPLAELMQVNALCYCNDQLTDGFIPNQRVPKLVNFDGLAVQTADGWQPVTWRMVVQSLLDAGMWTQVDGGYMIHDYLGCQLVHVSPGRRAWDAIRHFVRPRIFRRDGAKCATCGATHDLTIDHIIPIARGGSNAQTNLQVLCRSCNSRKGTR